MILPSTILYKKFSARDFILMHLIVFRLDSIEDRYIPSSVSPLPHPRDLPSLWALRPKREIFQESGNIPADAE